MVETLIALDKAFPKRIVIIGDALTDVWVHGFVDSCQDGCNKFVEQSRITRHGGAANAWRCLCGWNSTSELFAQEESKRGIKTRFVEDGIIFRHDDETRKTPEASYSYLRQTALLAAAKADAVLLSDYDKGFLTREFVADVVAVAKVCVADAKREPGFYEGCILKCNRAYAEVHGHELAGRGAIITNGKGCPVKTSTLMPYMGDGTVGCWMIRHHNAPVVCVNHVGAGDCFAAHLTLALAHGLSLMEAAAIAHSAGRVYVQHPHNRPPQLTEIRLDFLGAPSCQQVYGSGLSMSS